MLIKIVAKQKKKRETTHAYYSYPKMHRLAENAEQRLIRGKTDGCTGKPINNNNLSIEITF